MQCQLSNLYVDIGPENAQLWFPTNIVIFPEVVQRIVAFTILVLTSLMMFPSVDT